MKKIFWLMVISWALTFLGTPARASFYTECSANSHSPTNPTYPCCCRGGQTGPQSARRADGPSSIDWIPYTGACPYFDPAGVGMAVRNLCACGVDSDCNWIPGACCDTTAGICTAAACPITSQFGAAVRASRRGQYDGLFIPDQAPGDNPPPVDWGQAYDTNKNAHNFGRWLSSGTLSFHNASNPARYQSVTGTPAVDTYVQVTDPTSPLTQVQHLFPSDARETALIKVESIFGPDSVTNGVTLNPTWRAFVGNALYSHQLPERSMNGHLAWTLLNHPTDASVSPRFPPQYCGALTTPPAPWSHRTCDTLQNTIPFTDTFHAGVVDYGVNQPPDAVVPYVRLQDTGEWGILRGRVLGAGIPLAAASVAVYDSLSRFPPFEKITDASGDFELLLPIPEGNEIYLHVNEATPPPGVDLALHYVNPAYQTQISTQTLDWNAAFPKTNSSSILLNLPATSVGASGTGQIHGTVRAAETNAPLANITLELRDNAGHVLQATETDATGRYAFDQLADDTYYVVAMMDRNWVALPPRLSVALLPGMTAANQDVSVKGVSATVVIQPDPSIEDGSYIVLSTYSITGTYPPMIKPAGGRLPAIYGASLRRDKGTSISVAAGYSYFLNCWTLSSQNGHYTRRSAVTVGTPNPQQVVNVSCP